jgi:hypothetical protein
VADWNQISSLATGGGTLVLALATFASVRSANRSARIAEQALQEQRRPVLVHSRLEDPVQKIMFGDGRWVRVAGSRAVAEADGDTVYLAASLRNAGTGMAVLQSWIVRPQGDRLGRDPTPHSEHRAQLRDLYVPGNDIGMWQGRVRPSEGANSEPVLAAVRAREPLALELAYSDNVGGQRTISRFNLTPTGDENDWMLAVVRHWYLDGLGPR